MVELRDYSSIIFLVVVVLLVVAFSVVAASNNIKYGRFEQVTRREKAGDQLKSSNGVKDSYFGGNGKAFVTETSCKLDNNVWASGRCHCRLGKTGSTCEEDLCKNDFQPVSMSVPTNASLVELQASTLEFPESSDTALTISRGDANSIGVYRSGERFFSIVKSDSVTDFSNLIPVSSGANGWIKVSVYENYEVYDNRFVVSNSAADTSTSKQWWLDHGTGNDLYEIVNANSFHLFRGPWRINEIHPQKTFSMFIIKPPADATVLADLKTKTSTELAEMFRNNEVVNGKEVTIDNIHTEEPSFTLIILEPVVPRIVNKRESFSTLFKRPR